ncbi:MAG: alkaline phosphatase family protein [Saprospiraceae bacterium]
MKVCLLLLFCSLLFLSCSEKEKTIWIAQAPAGEQACIRDPEGTSILPNGRIIRPYGKVFEIAPHPFGLLLSPDGNIVVTANSGTNPLSVTVFQDAFSSQPIIRQIPPGPRTDRDVLAGVYMGLAITSDNQSLYVAGGQENVIYQFDLNSGEKLGEIDCSFQNDSLDFTHGFIGDLALNRDNSRLYALDQINFRLVVIDMHTKTIVDQIPLGRYPFGLAFSPDEEEIYVANVGIYEYQWIKGFDPKDPVHTSLDYPTSAYLSEESEKGYRVGDLEVPGLGPANTPESFSVWTVNVASGKVTAKVKTGFLVGEVIEGIPAVGGSSPNSIVATDEYVFVSNGTNDCISVISTNADTVIQTIHLRLDERLGGFRGIIPYGLALSPDHKRLFVAEAGINAVGVIDVTTLEVLGHIPVGWFPSKLQVAKSGGKLIVANAKGFGSGPNGGVNFDPGSTGSYVGNLMKGSVVVMDIPTDEELKQLTQQVLHNNVMFTAAHDPVFQDRLDHPIPLYPGEKESPVKHIVFVSKENRTYDEVFGQLPKGNGDAQLARYGYRTSFTNRDNSRQLDSVTVMPNHLALARQFAISDNFYVDADHSADGHRWLVCTYPNEWMETNVAAAYGGNRSFRWNSKAKGNLAFDGASGAIYPEDYNEAGSLWDHLERNGVDFWNFGFGIMFQPGLSDNIAYKKGYGHAINYPVPAPLYDKTSRIFPTYNMAIPDQFRIDKFIEEFDEKWINGQDTMPAVLTVIIGNDHGAGERPEAGFPFRESYMADNDLALGRLVEYLSSTPYWKNMVIVVTEDDAQGGVDHIDAHRSILMVISPYAKRDYVSNTHTSFGSIFKTFWNILGIPYLNQYDAAATDLSDTFTGQPDFTPYQAIAPDRRMFDPQRAYDPLDVEFDWSGLNEGPDLDDMEFLQGEARKFDEKQDQ